MSSPSFFYFKFCRTRKILFMVTVFALRFLNPTINFSILRGTVPINSNLRFHGFVQLKINRAIKHLTFRDDNNSKPDWIYLNPLRLFIRSQSNQVESDTSIESIFILNQIKYKLKYNQIRSNYIFPFNIWLSFFRPHVLVYLQMQCDQTRRYPIVDTTSYDISIISNFQYGKIGGSWEAEHDVTREGKELTVVVWL